MNEQRLQAYYQLIESLLSCPSGKEREILAANAELLDAGFLQMVEAVAEDFAQPGEENTAEWLSNLATQFSQETPSITQEDIMQRLKSPTFLRSRGSYGKQTNIYKNVQLTLKLNLWNPIN